MISRDFEKIWISLVNSNGFRRFAKWGPASIVFRHHIYQKLLSIRLYAITYRYRYQKPTYYQDVNTYCTFIGHTKSGGSLISSQLDAHQNIIMSDEMDALQFVSAGFSREQIIHIIARISRKEFLKGRVTARRLNPYSLIVPDQWQGRYHKLVVVGDSKAGKTTQNLANNPELLKRLRSVMGEVEIKFIHVIRNPYDPISIMMIRGQRKIQDAIEHYFDNCENLAKIRSQIGESNIFSIRYEDYIREPRTKLANLCHFLGVQASDEYLTACINVLRKTPDRSREQVKWDPQWIDVVKRKIDSYDFLDGYTYEN